MKRALAGVLLVSLLAITGCSTLDAINPWASTGPKMAELSAIKTSVEARVLWRENVGKSDLYSFTPAIVGTSVYAASADGTVVRLDNGTVAWKIKAGQALSGGIGADASMVVVGSPKGDLLAFSSADGKPLWSAKATSEVLAPPALGEGLVVVRSGDNRIAAYDAADGKRKWIYQRPSPALALRVTARPLIDGKTIFVGFPGGKLLALSAANGAALWDGTVAVPKGATELDRVADITSVPVISGRTICAVAFQGRVACFDLGNGTQVWARDMSSAVGLAIDGRTLFVTDDKGSVHALDVASGASVWKQEALFQRRVSAPLVHRGLLAVADVQGVVHFLSREDGSFVGRLTTDGSPVVAPLQALGSYFVLQTSRGGIFAIEAQ